jgi:hypothetical protein
MLDKEVAGLREKEAENRKDIHNMQTLQHQFSLALAKLSGKVEPLVDNGQPGAISRMNEKLDDLGDKVTQVLIAQGEADGRHNEFDWVRGVGASIIVGGLLVLAQHFWK